MIAPFAGLTRPKPALRPLLDPDPGPAELVEGEIAPPAGTPAPAVPEIDGGEPQVANDANQPPTLDRPADSGGAGV